MSDTALLLAMLLIPWAAALLIPLAGRVPNLREGVSFAAGAALLYVVARLVARVAAGARPELFVMEFAGRFEIAFELEPLGMTFAAIASSLWIVNTLFTLGYMRGNKEAHQTRFFGFVAVAIASAMAIAAAGNLVTLFVFYEVMTISTFPLVTHKGDRAARRGGTTYALVLMGTSLGLLFPAIIGTYILAGTTDFLPGGVFGPEVPATAIGILLFLFAYGIGKAALMPVHPWLPAAMVAPTPVSALLHAVAVVKAGVFTMLKVVVYTFGPGVTFASGASTVIAWIAAASIVIASLIALRQDNLKRRLAFSTVSQLSYVTLGAMLAAPAALIGAGLQIVMHAWGKITLFMCAGAIYTIAHRSDISSFDGLGRALPWVFGAFLVGSFSIIGIPPLGGSWPKFYLMLGSVERGQGLIIAALIISSVLNVVYLVPVAGRAFLFPPADAEADAALRQTRRRHWAVIAPPVLTAAGTLVLFAFAGDIADFLAPIADGAPILNGAPDLEGRPR